MDFDQSKAADGLGAEVSRRRTFAIISHPDAGKTTLTEKLLLFGGAIHLAGEVKAKGERRRARSDWMRIEQQRGISVTTSVMTFEYDGHTFNLLDTPGHEDFSEDTYRTLTAVDSAVMVIDAAKGIETQTLKLFEVCRMRDVPIMTFINKMDRETQDPLDLLDEIASKLALDVTPANWPIGMGQSFRGVWSLWDNRAVLMRPDADGRNVEEVVGDNALRDRVDPAVLASFEEQKELAQGALPSFDMQSYREGHLTPVFFGSALRNFGVRALLDALGAHAPAPRAQTAGDDAVEPTRDDVSGFVFKIQANMDPKHRDRVAFMRVCSGRFKRGMRLLPVRTGKPLTVSAPIFFFAQDRAIAEEAVAGDVIGIPNHGALRVGDTLTEGTPIRFTGLPNFAPEILMRVVLDDPMRAKHLQKALDDLAEEGVTQVFKPMLGAGFIVGVVGQLQLDVLRSRLDAEYGLPVRFDEAPYITARWVDSTDKALLDQFVRTKSSSLAEDRDGNPVYMARNNWDLNRVKDDFPKLSFTATRERS
ncbi:MAG TPA: peptide chain release factor 3 [Geminicoccus sp.]|uniref:peptide chain release factor 3 n=1 Tax=Geminicoccus sp. TaxID=2024832 RepID=UPI002E2F9E14|nr:peptide chain release factor 3 [Geminicoccus sp.]HEX2525311.1 peptide chain release factor 3 [Geminicoccus sp.]